MSFLAAAAPPPTREPALGYEIAISARGYRMTFEGNSLAFTIAGANSGALASRADPAKVQYQRVLPGIDVAYRTSSGRIETRFTVSEGADWHNIVLHFEGQSRLAIDADGNLVISVGGRNIIQELPVVLQHDRESMRLVSAAYVIRDNSNVAFRLGPYDRSRPIEITPVTVCSNLYSANTGGPRFLDSH
jgi:hypothetical protein